MANNYTNNFLIYQNEKLDTEIGSSDILNRYLQDKDYTYELIEDEIDIQDIKELKSYSECGVGLYDKNSIHFNRLKINELIKTVNKINKTIKQLDNKINK